jgi:hypothetical protein
MSEDRSQDRRQYRRLQAFILVRPAGLLARVARRKVSDISLGGLRTYADEVEPVGRRLELELLLQDGTELTLLAEVAWVEPLPPGAPARFETGLHLVDVRPEDRARLAAALTD